MLLILYSYVQSTFIATLKVVSHDAMQPNYQHILQYRTIERKGLFAMFRSQSSCDACFFFSRSIQVPTSALESVPTFQIGLIECYRSRLCLIRGARLEKTWETDRKSWRSLVIARGRNVTTVAVGRKLKFDYEDFSDSLRWCNREPGRTIDPE